MSAERLLSFLDVDAHDRLDHDTNPRTQKFCLDDLAWPSRSRRRRH